MIEPRIEEQPYDDRHNTPPRTPEGFETPWAQDDAAAVGQARETYMSHSSFIRTLDEAKQIIDAVRPGLTFKADNGATFLDVGRQMSDVAKEMHTLDLRVLLAHLDSAASAVKAELDRRY